MKLFNKIKGIAGIIILAATLTGCSLGSENNHSSCLRTYPTAYGVDALITLNSENKNIFVEVWEGSLESSNLRYHKTLNHLVRELWLETDVQYTIIAYYKKNGKSHQVVSGIKLSVSKVGKCYKVNNTIIDLRLVK